jgi:pimeloyl-ACP methyl ester carboxylesterase
MVRGAGRFWHGAREYVTHAVVGGAILTLTGFAPEEWLARVVHTTHVPEGVLHLWAAGIDVRAVIVVIGMTIIVGDLLWRRRSAQPALAHSRFVSTIDPARPFSALPIQPARGAEPAEAAGPALQVSYGRTPDGVRLAYAKIGHGPLLVKAGHWLTHLQHDWENPARRNFLQRLGKGRTLMCYDSRGVGLSDWDVEDISLEAWVTDLETVVEAAKVDRFALYGASQSSSVAITYAARHPERVSHLILYGGFAQGWMHRAGANVEAHKAMVTLMRLGWDQENPAFRQMFTAQFMPDASKEQFDAFTELGRKCTSSECAARYLEAVGDVDVAELLPRIAVPTLVMHVLGDVRVPFECGRQLAAAIPGAHFVALPGRNHVLLPGDPALERMFDEIDLFLQV